MHLESAMTPTEPDDPELADINALRRAERARHLSSRRVRHGSTALILGAVLVLVVLGASALWVIARP